MKKLIKFVFGKPDTESKWRRFVYRFAVGFYFFAIVLFIVQAAVNGGWLSILFPMIAFPILFRIVYRISKTSRKTYNGMNKRMLIIAVSIGSAVAIVTTVVLILIFSLSSGTNSALMVSKTEINDDVQLSIGTLRGEYEVSDFTVSESGGISIPYEAKVKDGKYMLVVKKSDEEVWRQEVMASEQGSIEFTGDKGHYKICIQTEEAKDVSVHLSL
ncbi:hypothetical protein [Bacillus inaquosorum]|uniref:hypothetical protein n=1 Tax=Bacillus inaquosorum TaxID=483913 RepID=UPI002282BB75|nr:hypothetical protein [Bacillus inaquosorum]MCY7979946.1 hypothetical protein [Bacillus inaquosorum]MCY8279577.1 hypothetical protein [Bacillus inaquosorum]MCY8753075.1 hypothetical protein [Bacillus inaquosorum]MCY9343654.1 hypothetical protein [Bacillus inaquosorum]MEC0679547.1 hypothetical protein [Bacillus inaquosorum]